MKEFEWPYVDPDICEDEPSRMGLWRLRPRCSLGGKVCCEIVPEFTADGHQASLMTLTNKGILERQIHGTFPNAEDYTKYRCVCKGGCNAEGKHLD
jgi:hypothetical protein